MCNKYLHLTKIIRAGNVQTVCNITPKPWSHIHVLGLGSSFWLFDPDFFILGSGSWESGPGSWVIYPCFWILDPWSKVSCPGSRVSVHSVIITKSGEKLIQSVTGIIKCNCYYKVWLKVNARCGRYYKV